MSAEALHLNDAARAPKTPFVNQLGEFIAIMCYSASDGSPTGKPMTRKRHPSARTDSAMRREIQQSEESNRALASRLGLDPKTVAKWRGRRTTEDNRKGPKSPASTVLTRAEEALILIYRKRTLFTIDDCWPVLKKAIPHLSRSALHRCLVRYGVSRIPAGNTKKPSPTEDFHYHTYTVELYTLPVEMGGSYLLFAIGKFKGFVFAKAVDGFSDYETADFLAELIKRSPIRIVSIETSDHEAFTDAEGRPWDAIYPLRKHPFRKACQEDGIAHIRSKRPAPIKVSRGWRGVALKSVWDLYLRSPTKHYRRKTIAQADKAAKRAVKTAIERSR